MRASIQPVLDVATLHAELMKGALMPDSLLAILSCNDYPGEDIVLISPENYIKMIKGSSLTLTLSVEKSDGTVKDLTGARIYMTVKRSLSDRSPLIQKISTSSSQILISGQPARLGKASIFFVPGDTANLETGNYIFDVWAVFTDGSRVVLIPPSVFEISAGVTYLV